MKTLISAALFMALSFGSYPYKANAQVGSANAAAAVASVAENNFVTFSGEKSGKKADASTVNMRATKDFSKTFKNVNNQTWYKVGNGYIANFLSEGVDYRVNYDNKGRWQSNLLTYTEDHLPFEVRDLVKSRFYDYDIFICYEYQFTEGKAYIIKMEDAKSYKTLKVYDGEIISEEDLTKSN